MWDRNPFATKRNANVKPSFYVFLLHDTTIRHAATLPQQTEDVHLKCSILAVIVIVTAQKNMYRSGNNAVYYLLNKFVQCNKTQEVMCKNSRKHNSTSFPLFNFLRERSTLCQGTKHTEVGKQWESYKYCMLNESLLIAPDYVTWVLYIVHYCLYWYYRRTTCYHLFPFHHCSATRNLLTFIVCFLCI